MVSRPFRARSKSINALNTKRGHKSNLSQVTTELAPASGVSLKLSRLIDRQEIERRLVGKQSIAVHLKA